MQDAIGRRVEDISPVRGFVDRQTVATIRRKAKRAEAGLRIHARNDLKPRSIKNCDRSVAFVSDIGRFARRRERNRRRSLANLYVANLRQLPYIYYRKCAVLFVGDEDKAIVIAHDQFMMPRSGS